MLREFSPNMNSSEFEKILYVYIYNGTDYKKIFQFKEFYFIC